MDFDKRLERAISRGEQSRVDKGRARQQQQLTEEQWRTLHSQLRLEMSEHIEDCLKKLADHFPGFRFQTVVGEDGWGAKISRDDFVGGVARENRYSRLEMLIRPFSSTHILELAAKGTIKNKEAFNRTHYQFLADADPESFRELVDLWVVEYAEQYAARH